MREDSSTAGRGAHPVTLRVTRRLRLTALAAGLALSASAAGAELPEHPAILSGPPPAWVAPAGETAPAPAGASASAYRRVDHQLLADGAATAVYSERVIEVLSQQGLDDAAQWEITFDRWSSSRAPIH